MKVLSALLFAAFVPLATAQAALIDMDSPLGPNTAVLDTSTNLEWLKLSATAGQTPDQIFAQTAPGGLLEGYRYASVDELTCGLLGPQLRGGGCVYSGGLRNVDVALEFMERFGKSFDRIGLFQPIFLEGHIPQVYGESWHATQMTDILLIDVDTQVANLQPARSADHWLVHQVPEPSTLALLGIAALALATRKRRPENSSWCRSAALGPSAY
jgi:hypothetical protein